LNTETFDLDIDRIVDRYADMVYRIALTQMKNVHDAQDIFQEVFLRLVKNIDTIQNEEHLKSWLIRVTLNCSKTNLMSGWRKHTQPLEDEQNQLVFETKEQSDLYEYIQKLPKKYRTVLYLFYYEELSIKQICDITGQKETTVKSQLSRARSLLKKELENAGWSDCNS
jgi:RNA polymerase sigma-70 factor (ECF subfamily)